MEERKKMIKFAAQSSANCWVGVNGFLGIGLRKIKK